MTVLQNPIGLHPDFPTYFPDSFAEWANEQRAAHPDLDKAALRSFGENMWAGEFVFSVSRDFVRRCSAPALVLPGDDTPHPAVTGGELAENPAGCRDAARLERSRASGRTTSPRSRVPREARAA